MPFILAGCEASFFSIFPRVSSNCTAYTVLSGDTCTSIGRSQNVTYAQLLSRNFGINSVCSYVFFSRGHMGCIANDDFRNLGI